jgi:hypothetical protein
MHIGKSSIYDKVSPYYSEPVCVALVGDGNVLQVFAQQFSLRI